MPLRVKLNFGDRTMTNGAAEYIGHVAMPSNRRGVVEAVELTFDGTSGTAAPFDIEVIRRSGADNGTWTGNAVITNADPSHTETPQGTYQTFATANPTSLGNVIKTYHVHPQAGIIILDPEEIAGGGGLYYKITNNSGGDLQVRANARVVE